MTTVNPLTGAPYDERLGEETIRHRAARDGIAAKRAEFYATHTVDNQGRITATAADGGSPSGPPAA